MNKHLIQLLLTIALITGCGTATPSLSPTATVTQTIAPSQTPRPTQAIIPTATPYPPLQTNGPYLLFPSSRGSLTIMDADGSGFEQIQLPEGGYVHDLKNAISPDGKWLAYYTGLVDQVPYNLALNLFNLDNGTSFPISNLLASGYPKNLEPLTKTIQFTADNKDCSNSHQCRMNIIEIEFKTGIWAFDWSPNSQYFAFAAQIDDPSSDIYIYDLPNKITRRLSNEPENIGISINWSPNGEKILYESSIPSNAYFSLYLHLADPKIKEPMNPVAIADESSWMVEYGWVDENSYLIYYIGDGAPPNHFHIINIETHQVKEVWNYSAESFFVDLKKKTIILSPYGRIYSDPNIETGIYTVSFDGNYQKVSNEIIYFIEGQDAVTQYIAITQDNQLVGVKLDGSITPLSRKPDYNVPPKSSPDGKWKIITSETVTELYSEDLQLIKSLGIHATDIVWRPDSAGVFLYNYPTLYYLATNDEELKLREVCTSENCIPFEYVWLP